MAPVRKWYYACSICDRWQIASWSQRGEYRRCFGCGWVHCSPQAREQPHAFVEGHDVPDAMREAVFAYKGRECSVPNCERAAEQCDHRDPNGQTSFFNLYPMCGHHNASKGNQDFLAWWVRQLATQSRRGLQTYGDLWEAMGLRKRVG
jgi:hypothetical protein